MKCSCIWWLASDAVVRSLLDIDYPFACGYLHQLATSAPSPLLFPTKKYLLIGSISGFLLDPELEHGKRIDLTICMKIFSKGDSRFTNASPAAREFWYQWHQRKS